MIGLAIDVLMKSGGAAIIIAGCYITACAVSGSKPSNRDHDIEL